MNMIVMMDKTGCIGVNGNQPVHLAEDLRRFKELTTNKIVICGRKTVDTFPGQLPLKNRSMIVISKSLNLATYLDMPDRSATIIQDPFIVVKHLKDINPSNVLVIGGASIYRELIPWTTRVFVTQVHTIFNRDNPESKVYFPIEILDSQFEVVDTTNIYDYDRCTKDKYKTSFIEYVRL